MREARGYTFHILLFREDMMVHRRGVSFLMVALLLCVLTGLAMPPTVSLAQADKISVAINGRPRVEGALVSALVSVTEPGGAIGDLDPDAFIVTEGVGQPVTGLDVRPVAAGLAVVMVIDRGGIAARNSCLGPTGNIRVTEAKGLARTFVEQLVINNVPDVPDDMVALVGIGAEGSDGKTEFWPDQDFSHNPVDRNLVLNALEPLDAPDSLFPLGTTTPLYEGLFRAMDWLKENKDIAIRDELAGRHKLILVFSDGIDRGYSDEATELDIIDRAREADINVYSVGMGCPSVPQRLVPDSLRHFSTQTGGRYWPHDSVEGHAQVLENLPELLTYRRQYQLSFTTHLRAGEYTLGVRVDTVQGADEDETTFFSPLQPPYPVIESPRSAYTLGQAAALSTILPVTVTVTFPDNVLRDIGVEFLVDGTLAYTTTATPPYRFDWDLASLGPTRHTLTVRTVDTLLTGEAPQEVERTIEIVPVTPTPEPTLTPTPRPVIPPPPGGRDVGGTGNLFMWLVPLLIVAVIALVVLLSRTRQQVGAVVARGVRGVTTRLTRVLSTHQSPARAKLVITRGRNMNHEYRIQEQITRFGRERDSCDEVVDDDAVSAHHFSITYDASGTSFFIMDHGSRNGTYLNNQQIPPNQYIPLEVGSSVRAGQTELVFQRIGGTTRILGP